MASSADNVDGKRGRGALAPAASIPGTGCPAEEFVCMGEGSPPTAWAAAHRVSRERELELSSTGDPDLSPAHNPRVSGGAPQ